MWAREDEIPRLEALLQSRYHELPPTAWQDGVRPDGRRLDIRTVVQVGTPSFRAVAKIVFHSALKVFPDLDGSAAGFEPIRRFIREGVGNGFVTELGHQVVESFRRGMRPTQWSHILMAQRDFRRVIGYAQFFVSPESMPFPFRVDIGPNPGRLYLGRQRRAHVFLVDAVDGGGRPHGRPVDFQLAELHLGLP